MTLSTDDVLQELRTVSPTDSADSLLVLGALAPGRVQANGSLCASEALQVPSRSRGRHTDASRRRGMFRHGVSSDHNPAQKNPLPHVLGSPLYGAVAILILILALSASLTLLLIQAVNISHLDSSLSASSLHTGKNVGHDEKHQDQSQVQSLDPLQSQSQQSSVKEFTPVPATAPETAGIGVNVNTASKEELENIPGVGPVTAQRILDYRTAHGAFTSVDQLTRVSGIGVKTLEKMRNHVRIQ